MSDVARDAGVSSSTVSLFLRDPTRVSERARAAIARAVDRSGYVPNRVAGGLAAASSRVVGVIVPSFRNAFFAETVTVLQDTLAEAGLQTLVGHTEYSQRREEELVEATLSWSPAGMVLTGLEHSERTRRMLAASGVPVVEVWEVGTEPIDMIVGISHPKVGRMAAQHLAACGRRHPVYLGARLQEDRRAAQRAAGFEEGCRSFGLSGRVIAHPAPASVESGALLLDKLESEAPEADAVACSNDVVALGVLFECGRRGIKVPGDLAIVGFGDLDFSAFSTPPLTTIRPSGDQIARETSRLLRRRIEGAELAEADRIVDIGASLIVRGSG